MGVMFANSFSPIDISDDKESELFVLCQQLKNCKSKNSPWSLFFPKKRSSKTSENFFNLYEISEVSIDELTSKSDSSDSDILLDDDEQMCIDGSGRKSTEVLDKVLEDKLPKLKEILHSIKDDYPRHQCCPQVSIFNSITPGQISQACEILHLSTLSDTAIAVVLNSLSLLDPAISLITAASVIHHVVYLRMKNWTSYASRSLITVILMFTKKYPKAMVDELLLPCLKDESFDLSQSDLTQDIMRDGLPDDHVHYCIREFLGISCPNENIFAALQCLIERKVPIDPNLCYMLIEKMYDWCTSFSSSCGFSKLLKSIILTYGSEMTKQQLSVLSTTVANTTTFFKKTIQNLLKRLIEEHD